MAKTSVLIIGNGIAGFSAAAALRRLNADCAVTMVSIEETPLYSACVLPDVLSGRVPREKVFVKMREDYETLGIQTHFGSLVKAIDTARKRVLTEEGEGLAFDKLILATGSEPVLLGDYKKGVFKVKTLRDTDDLIAHQGRQAVIIGSGAIGIEVAIALRRKGYEVTLLEMQEGLLPLGLDRGLSNKIRGILEDRGIPVHLGEKAEKVLGGKSVEGVLTARGTLPCDTLVWAVGMRPRTELAGAAGLVLGLGGGIRVDERMQTSLPDVYACGDCVETTDLLTGEPSLNLFWYNASQQGRVTGRNCAGIVTTYPGSQSVLNLDVFGHHVAAFGRTEASLRRTARDRNQKGTDISFIENEKNGSSYRLVIKGNRCVGGQFINVHKDVGLLRSLMVQKRDIAKMVEIFQNPGSLYRRGWLSRVRPFFENDQHK